MNHDHWPGVDEAVAALREAFGLAYIEHTGGDCFSIYVPIEGMGVLSVGDMHGPLGDSNQGWGAELIGPDGEYQGQVCNVPDRSVPKLVEALRAFLRYGTRTGVIDHDLLYMRRDQHHSDTGHFVDPAHAGDPELIECREIHQGFQADKQGRGVGARILHETHPHWGPRPGGI